MSACKDTRNWLTENLTKPVNKATSGGMKVCHEVQKKIEESFEEPIEEWVSQQEERCHELAWWNPLRWFCELVMVLVKVVTWVVVTVVKWVPVIVCHVVSAVVKIVGGLVSTVVRWAVGTVVCLFSEPKVALTGLVDLWTGILDAVGEVIDLVGVLLEDLGGILVDVGHLFESIGVSLGPLGTLIAGLVKWVINLLTGLVKIVRELIDGIRDLVLGILRLDWCQILRGLTTIGLGIVQVILLIPRILGGIVGGIRDAFQQERLAEIVEEALATAFAGDPDGLARARKKVRLGQRPFGMPIVVDARRFFVSSRSRTVDLRDLHKRGIIDLNAAVGTWSSCRGQEAGNWSRREVVYAETAEPVDWSDIQLFLDDGPDAVAEFRVYAMPLAVLERDLKLAQQKAPQVGVTLSWTIGDLEVVDPGEVPLPDTDAGNDGVMGRVGRNGKGDDMCHPPAVAIFSYTNAQRNGLTSELRLPDLIHPSGVTFRDRMPEWFFRWILIHELGHYLGLDHPGHDGLENIMFTKDETAGLKTITPATVAEYVLLTGESRFTLDDARAVWRWIPANAKACLT